MHKKHITIGLLALALVAGLIYAQTPRQDNSDSARRNKQIESYTKVFGTSFFRALYSIDELKPYFIIQIDRVSNAYNNRWMSPDSIVNILKKRDKDVLLSRFKEYVGNLESEKQKDDLLQHIRSWCLTDLQMAMIKDNYISDNPDIIETIYSIHNTKHIVAQYYGQSGGKPVTLSKEQIDKIYYQTINTVAVLAHADQMKYYADVFSKLASLEKKK